MEISSPSFVCAFTGGSLFLNMDISMYVLTQHPSTILNIEFLFTSPPLSISTLLLNSLIKCGLSEMWYHFHYILWVCFSSAFRKKPTKILFYYFKIFAFEEWVLSKSLILSRISTILQTLFFGKYACHFPLDFSKREEGVGEVRKIR